MYMYMYVCMEYYTCTPVFTGTTPSLSNTGFAKCTNMPAFIRQLKRLIERRGHSERTVCIVCECIYTHTCMYMYMYIHIHV